jgi:hypothetical protein
MSSEPVWPEILFEGDALTPAQRETFTADARGVFEALDMIRRNASIPPTETTLVVAGDFTASVRAHQQPNDEEPFVAERGYGRVRGKNLPQDDTDERVVIVFDHREWSQLGAGHDRWAAVGMLAHELAHPVLTRARRVSGVLDGVPRPSHTPTEIARSLSRIASDEYKADVIADMLLERSATTIIDGVASPVRTWDVHGRNYIDGVHGLFARLHPQLPDVVQSYREWRLDLMSMWVEVVRQSEAIVTAFMHARAHADEAAAPVAILEAESIRDLPFVRLYLADTIPPYLAAVRDGPLVPAIADYAADDAEIVTAGERMFFEIWRRLGLTFTEKASTREFGMKVVEPLR